MSHHDEFDYVIVNDHFDAAAAYIRPEDLDAVA